jgi:hypothetical protein
LPGYSIGDIFANRFLMNVELKELSQERIERDYCSILIKAKNKKRIIKELAGIGITVDYMYPELEYTAKEIKRRYE